MAQPLKPDQTRLRFAVKTNTKSFHQESYPLTHTTFSQIKWQFVTNHSQFRSTSVVIRENTTRSLL